MSRTRFRKFSEGIEILLGSEGLGEDALKGLLRELPSGFRRRHVARALLKIKPEHPIAVAYKALRDRQYGPIGGGQMAPIRLVRPPMTKGPEYYRRRQQAVAGIEKELGKEG